MKKTSFFAAVLGLALVFGTAVKSEAFCLLLCADTGDSSSVDIDKSNVTNKDGAQAVGAGNTSVNDVSNSVVIGGDVDTRQSNFIGGIGLNKGDISQSNSANITGQQNQHMEHLDMKDMRQGGR
jgi:hypothetical protein